MRSISSRIFTVSELSNEELFDMETINPEFSTTDLALHFIWNNPSLLGGKISFDSQSDGLGRTPLKCRIG